MTTDAVPSRLRARNGFLAIKSGDIAVAVYVLGAVAFSDGSLLAQASRVVLVALAAIELSVKPFRISLVLLWQALFVCYVMWSASWAFSVERAESQGVTVLVNGVCVALLAYLLIGEPARLRLVIVCMTVAPVILLLRVGVAEGLFVFLETRTTEDAQANFVGMAAAVGFGLGYVCASQRIIMSRWVALLFLSCDLLAVLLSASRKAVLMVALIVLLFTILDQRARGASRWVRVGGAGLVTLAGYWLIMNVQALYLLVGYRIEGLVEGLFGNSAEADASTRTRLTLINDGMSWFQDSPWFGHGADNFRALMATYHPDWMAYYAHNNFVEILVNLGLVGLVLFYWLYVVVIFTGLKRRSSGHPVQAIFLSIIIGLLLTEYGHVDYYSRFFMALVGVCWVAVCTSTVQLGYWATNGKEATKRADRDRAVGARRPSGLAEPEA